MTTTNICYRYIYIHICWGTSYGFQVRSDAVADVTPMSYVVQPTGSRQLSYMSYKHWLALACRVSCLSLVWEPCSGNYIIIDNVIDVLKTLYVFHIYTTTCLIIGNHVIANMCIRNSRTQERANIPLASLGPCNGLSWSASVVQPTGSRQLLPSMPGA